MLRCLLPVCVLAFLSVPVAADDVRERKVKVALALAAGKTAASSSVVAPAPRPAPKNYSAGYKAATEEQMPLVVYVGCRAESVSGAVVARTDSLGDVIGPAVVVGFPSGDKLFIEVTLKGTPSTEDVKKAVAAARKKIDSPAAKDVLAPKPLFWNL